MHRNYTLWSCQKVSETLTILNDNIYIRFGTKVFRRIIGILMGQTAHGLWLISDSSVQKETSWCLFSEEKQSEVTEDFESRYLDNLLYSDNNNFNGLISQIYPSELQLYKSNSSETESPFLNSHLSILDRFISCKIYDNHIDFDFEIVNFPYLDGDVPHEHPTVFIYCN